MKRLVISALFVWGCAQGSAGDDAGAFEDTALPDGSFPDTFASPDVPIDAPSADGRPADAPLADSGGDARDAVSPDAGPSCTPTMSGTWQEVGATSLASGAHADTILSPDGTIARIFLSGAPPSPRVETFDGTTWRALGTFAPAAVNINVVGIAHDGSAFVAMVVASDGSTERPVVYRLNGGSWVELFRVGSGAPAGTHFSGSSSLWSADGVVRVAGVMQPGDFASRRVVVAEQRSGATQDLMGPPNVGMFGSFAPSVADVSGNALLTWGVVGELQLARFNGTWMSWSTTGLFTGFASNSRVASRGPFAWVAGTDFVDINTNIVRLFRVNGENLVAVEGTFDRDPATGPAFVADMAVDALGRAVLAMTEPLLPGGTTQHVHVVRASMDGVVPLGMPIDATVGDTSGTASIASDACSYPVLTVVEARAPASTDYDVRTYRYED